MPHQRLFPPQAAISEKREVVTKRSWRVSSRNDILAVIETLGRERAVGRLTLNFGPGGSVNAMEFEERGERAS